MQSWAQSNLAIRKHLLYFPCNSRNGPTSASTTHNHIYFACRERYNSIQLHSAVGMFISMMDDYVYKFIQTITLIAHTYVYIQVWLYLHIKIYTFITFDRNYTLHTGINTKTLQVLRLCIIANKFRILQQHMYVCELCTIL